MTGNGAGGGGCRCDGRIVRQAGLCHCEICPPITLEELYAVIMMSIMSGGGGPVTRRHRIDPV